ncbi:helix-turn-helix domain-containing protein [Streptomyces sp. NPDC085995]|uniref:helix-turn-helix domain-containing protein n=1 Tax=Streptomyces sp. NPDC085995 TaxID=3154861 RepID=UPI003441F774
MSRATRRIIVAHLSDRGMSPAEIAAELGVSRDTVRRDLADAPPPAPAPEPEPAPPVAAGLLLPDGVKLRADLDVLTAAYKAARPEDAARFAIHQAAAGVRRYWLARAGAGQQTGGKVSGALQA